MGERKEAENAGSKLKTLWLRVKSGLFKVGEYLLPSGITCVSCGNELGEGDLPRYSLCKDCAELLPYRTGHYCKLCGNAIDEGVLCKHCETATPVFDRVIAPFNYGDFPRKMIITQKEAGATYLFSIVARFLADTYKGYSENATAVCYVPTYKKAVKRRGADHTRRVAELFGKEAGIPVYNALVRVEEKGDQTAFSRTERFANVKGAFALSQNPTDIPPKNSKVILIDDVVTTGATASECAAVLKSGGVKEVIVVCLARR